MFEAHVFCLLQIYVHDRQDITETNLKPALCEGELLTLTLVVLLETCLIVMSSSPLVSAVGTQTAFLETQVATFTRHRSRLAVVREQKAKARLDMLGENEGRAEQERLRCLL